METITLNPMYLSNKEGKTVAVQLSWEEYKALLEELDMAEDVRLFREAKNEDPDYMTLEEYQKTLTDK